MSLIQKYIWVVKTIHRTGRITLKELNEKWRDNVDLSRGEDLPRQTFDRWKGGILDMFGIVIECEAKGGYHYYIANPSVMDRGELRTWLNRLGRDIAHNFAQTIAAIPEVTECYNFSGRYDYLLKIHAPNMKYYQEFVLNVLGTIEHLGSLESTFVMDEIKHEYGICLPDDVK